MNKLILQSTIIAWFCLFCFVRAQPVWDYQDEEEVINLSKQIRESIESLHLAELKRKPPPGYDSASAEQFLSESNLLRQISAIKSIPVGGYIKTGRTHCNSTDNPQNYYTTLNDHAYITVVYYFNEVLGGMLINGTRYLIEDINYPDGAECVIMKILYRKMVEDDGAQFLFAPTNPDCAVLAKYAEYKEIIYGNGADYSLPVLYLIPNATFQYNYNYLNEFPDAVYDISYNNLSWVFNIMGNQTQAGYPCAIAYTDPSYIDQSKVPQGKGPVFVKSAVFASNQQEVPYLAEQSRSAMLALGVKELMPNTNINLDDFVTQGCPYLYNLFMNQWKKLNPDYVCLITGASNTSDGVNCMHEIEFQPGATNTPVPPIESEYETWQSQGYTNESPFFASVNFQDPIMGSLSNYVGVYTALFNVTPTFYEISISTTMIILLDCINQTQSLTSSVVRECIRTYNKTTIYGQVSFTPEHSYINRPNVCVQQQNVNGSYYVVYPKDYPGRVPTIFPYPFVYNQTFLDNLHPRHHLGLTNEALIITFSILGFLIIVAVIVVLIGRWKYEWVFINKKELVGNDWVNQ